MAMYDAEIEKKFRYIVGDFIRERRDALNMTQSKLAEDADIEETHVGKIERGVKLPSSFTLWKIMVALQTSLGALDDVLEKSARR